MKDLGKIFKGKLQEQNFENADKYWPALESRLDKAMPTKRSNKKFLWLILSLISVSGLLLMMQSENILKSQVASNNNLDNTNTSIHSTTIANSKSSNNGEIKKSGHSNSIVVSSINSDNNINSEFTPKSDIKLSKTQNTNKLVLNKEKVKNETNGLSESNSLKNNRLKTDAKTLNTINQISTNSLISTENKSTNNSKEEVNSSKVANASLQNKLLKEVAIASNDENLDNLLMIHSNNFIQENIFLSPQVSLLNGNKNQAIDVAQANSKIESDLNLSKKHDDDFAKKKSVLSRFSVSIYAGSMYVGKNIFKSNSIEANYLSRRKLEEKNTMTMTYGSDVVYSINNWNITTGLNYHTQAENRNYSNKFYKSINVYDPYWETVTSNTWQHNTHHFTVTHVSTQLQTTVDTINYYDATLGYTSLPVNNSTLVIDTHSVTHTYIDSTIVTINDSVQKFNTTSKRVLVVDSSQTNLTGTNRITYFEVPLLIGYQLQFNKFALNVRTGLGLGILASHNAYYINNDLTGISELKSDSYNKLIYNYIFRLSLLYNVSNKLGVYLEPNFRANINSVTKRGADFQQRYWNIGSNVGLTYRF